jgi:hypothetical protein
MHNSGRMKWKVVFILEDRFDIGLETVYRLGTEKKKYKAVHIGYLRVTHLNEVRGRHDASPQVSTTSMT